ncbi:hypothetical protein OESDEN_08311 [Oesophagostomum dentatum]|uniref:Uncharacterized protein n=1 Tax=Oesophagostomum dentatum TaxID=61180 RepID=A0A0B1T6P8_OESDE|nr:hypothetical protein OESDEN_08311 [Oesophagostomum dentatum]
MLENLQNLVTTSESCLSTKSKSTISLSFENMDADVDVFITPKNEELADVMKNVELAKKSASFASDLVSSVANSISRSSSVQSVLSWSSYSDGEEAENADEIDLDEEMEKYNFAESPTGEHELNKAEFTYSKKSVPSSEEGRRKTRAKARISLRDVASEVLTKVSVTSSGFRSRIPRPVDMERFNSRNAAANTDLRRRFLKRNKSPEYEECRLFPENSP